MKRRGLLFIFVALLHFQCTVCLIDPITIGLGSIGAGLLYTGYQKYIKCSITAGECCDAKHIPIDVYDLRERLEYYLHGQHIVEHTVANVMRGYKFTSKLPKALSMSFHGPPGTGKNFVARMIAETFYKKGIDSEYYHYFSGSIYSDKHLESDKDQIRDIIAASLWNCERSMFVFDEVDMMPAGMLDVLLPFLNYGTSTTAMWNKKLVNVPTNKAIFIFLSNRAGPQIVERTVNFWNEGKSRESLTLKDFENVIARSAFNEEGGFLKSRTIGSSLIDYYVPFLPLEKKHVELCMENYLTAHGVQLTAEMKDEVMSIVTYGPKPENIYALSGCKRIESKVTTLGNIESTDETVD